MVSLFAPDASFGGYGTGPGACRRLSEESLAQVGVAVLMVANHIIEFYGAGQARGSVWCHAHVDDRREGFIEQLIKYDDRYALVGGRWLFASRRHLLWYGIARPPGARRLSRSGSGPASRFRGHRLPRSLRKPRECPQRECQLSCCCSRCRSLSSPLSGLLVMSASGGMPDRSCRSCCPSPSPQRALLLVRRTASGRPRRERPSASPRARAWPP